MTWGHGCDNILSLHWERNKIKKWKSIVDIKGRWLMGDKVRRGEIR
jgi:hypothetical protein